MYKKDPLPVSFSLLAVFSAGLLQLSGDRERRACVFGWTLLWFYWSWHCFHIHTNSFDQISNKTNLEISINRNSFDQISYNANNVIHSATSSFDQIPQNATSRLTSIPHNDFNPDLGSELVHFICIQ